MGIWCAYEGKYKNYVVIYRCVVFILVQYPLPQKTTDYKEINCFLPDTEGNHI